MAEQTLTCADCNKTGTVTQGWIKPGVASGTIMTGLDPENCDGCREALNKHGYAVVKAGPDGTIEAE